jgi:hypothetical protein
VLFEDILCQLVDMIGPEVSPSFIFLHLWLFRFNCAAVWHVVTILSFAEWRIYHITRCQKQQTFWKCFQHSFQSQQVHRFWNSWSFSHTPGTRMF